MTELPYKLEYPKITIYKNGTNPYLYYYFSWNKQTHRGSTGCRDLNQAKIKATDIYYEVTKGRVSKKKKLKLRALFKKFIKFKQDSGIAERTIKDYNCQSKIIFEFFEDWDVESIGTKSAYLQYHDWRKNYYKKKAKRPKYKKKGGSKFIIGRTFSVVGNRTINKDLRLLVSILRFGKEYGGLFKNTEIAAYKMLPEKNRSEILEKDEYLRLEEYWNKTNPYYWSIINFVYSTGLRYPSELNNLRWKDVYLEKEVVIIRNRKNKNKNKTINSPVPMVGPVRDIIEDFRERNLRLGIRMDPEAPVFVNDKALQVLDIGKAFKKGLLQNGIEKNLTMYNLRHTFTTNMVIKGLSNVILAKILGHTSTSMVDKIYSHLNDQDIINAFRKVQKTEDQERQEQTKLKEEEVVERNIELFFGPTP